MFVCFSSHFFNLNRPTRYAYCRKYIRKINRGAWEVADMQRAITDVKAKRFDLNVALHDANQAKKHQSLYTLVVTYSNGTSDNQEKKSTSGFSANCNFQAIFASKLVVMSYIRYFRGVK